MKTKSVLKLRVLTFFISIVTFLNVQGQEFSSEIRHSIFIAGPQFTGILNEDGNVVWDAGKPKARDGYVLKNGNILICWKDEVREYNKDKEIVLNYRRSEKNMELGTAVRLKKGRTLITESGKTPRIVIISKKGKVINSIPIQPETDNTHMQTRMARKLRNGNYIVPHLLAFAIKEYKSDGTVVKKLSTDFKAYGGRKAKTWPFTAIRLKNGNTLVALTNGNRVVELSPDGKITWEINNSLYDSSPLADPCGVQRLPNGNTVVASYGAKKDQIKIFEVDRNKKIVWSHDTYKTHHFQVLTTSGEPVKGKPLK